MQTIKSFKEFESTIMKTMKPMVSKLLDGEEGTELMVSMGRFMLNGKKMQPQHRTHTNADQYVWLVFDSFLEISSSFYTLRDIEIILRSITSRPSKLSKARLLAYHIHNYLNENYILKLRLERYPVTLLRASKRWLKYHHIIKPINGAISSVFKNIVAVRGGHVHDRRYADDDLDRLRMLESLAEAPMDGLAEATNRLYQADFTVCRGRWLDRMLSNNNAVEEFLGLYFTTLWPIIFDDMGKIIVPAK